MNVTNPTITVQLIPDPEQGGFTARIPDIPAYGETKDEAIADLKEVVRGYIETFGLDDALTGLSSPSAIWCPTQGRASSSRIGAAAAHRIHSRS